MNGVTHSILRVLEHLQERGDEVLVIFRAAEGYISPSWYPSKQAHHQRQRPLAPSATPNTVSKTAVMAGKSTSFLAIPDGMPDFSQPEPELVATIDEIDL